MSMVDCPNCRNRSEARSLSKCKKCGTSICPECQGKEGYCQDCADMMD